MKNSVDASAFLPPEEPNRISGRLAVSGAGVVFTREGRDAAMPLSGLELRLGGANDRLIFFSNTARPGWSFFTADQRILDDLAEVNDPRLAGMIQAIRNARKRTRLTLAAIAAAVVLVCVLLWSVRSYAVSGLVSVIPVEWEKALGRAAFAAVRQQTTLIEDAELQRRLERLIDPLVSTVDAPYELKVHISTARDINAFALPGGTIVFNSGLILEAESAEEILGVLAHEIGHVEARHSLRGMVQSLGVAAVAQMLLGDASGLAALVSEGVPFLLQRQFSRDHEMDADERAWKYLTDAGINPEGLAAFFGRIQKVQQKSPLGALDQSLNFMSTHPPTSERMAAIRKKLAAAPSDVRPLDFDLPEFKKLLRTRLSEGAGAQGGGE